MKYGILGDIHNKVGIADVIINSMLRQVDHVILLGDYVDDFNDTPDSFRAVLIMLGIWQDNEHITCLVGNHEAAYMNARARCTGWDWTKQSLWDEAIRGKIFTPLKLKWGMEIEDFLITHAGLADKHHTPDKQREAVEELILMGRFDVDALGYHIHDNGSNSVGSILTNRVRYNKLNPRYRQVFGHTQGKCADVLVDADGTLRSACIDTGLRHWLELDIDGDGSDFVIHQV